MKLLIQRVSSASVQVQRALVAEIQLGLLVFVGLEAGDQNHIDLAINKLLSFRIFEDQHQKMNLNVQQVSGEILWVSQFTLCADLSQGNRPSFGGAMPFQEAFELFDVLYERAIDLYPAISMQKGSFGADMSVSLVNEGPATFHWVL